MFYNYLKYGIDIFKIKYQKIKKSIKYEQKIKIRSRCKLKNKNISKFH